jgi:hypothetical protein
MAEYGVGKGLVGVDSRFYFSAPFKVGVLDNIATQYQHITVGGAAAPDQSDKYAAILQPDHVRRHAYQAMRLYVFRFVIVYEIALINAQLRQVTINLTGYQSWPIGNSWWQFCIAFFSYSKIRHYPSLVDHSLYGNFIWTITYNIFRATVKRPSDAVHPAGIQSTQSFFELINLAPACAEKVGQFLAANAFRLTQLLDAVHTRMCTQHQR